MRVFLTLSIARGSGAGTTLEEKQKTQIVNGLCGNEDGSTDLWRFIGM